VLIDSDGKVIGGSAVDSVIVDGSAVGENDFLKCVWALCCSQYYVPEFAPGISESVSSQERIK
jgi:hypothetical protein